MNLLTATSYISIHGRPEVGFQLKKSCFLVSSDNASIVTPLLFYLVYIYIYIGLLYFIDFYIYGSWISKIKSIDIINSI